MITEQINQSRCLEYSTSKNDIVKVINLLLKTDKSYSNKIAYWNIPISFDIETSSFLNEYGEKVGIMYIWMIKISDYIIYGRTWIEFNELINYFVSKFDTNFYQRIVIYVHNLGYEMGFIGNYFEWEKVQALKKHKPYNALTITGIEFRCSLFLSGYSLKNLAENLEKHKYKKLVGDLDYNKIRHSETLLTVKELAYCFADVDICTAYVSEMMEEYGGIANIPNTRTGKIRRLFRKEIFSDKKSSLQYKDLISSLVFDSLNEYEIVRSAYTGGFTHCNPYYSNKIINDIMLYIDFASSYPFVMVADSNFPMYKVAYYEKPTLEIFYKSLEKYSCIFTLTLINVKTKFANDNYISASKCIKFIERKTVPLNNGRIVEAEMIAIDITNIDFEIISKCYTWEEIYITNLYCYQKSYLPKQFVEVILELYKNKTSYKGIEEKESVYKVSKEFINGSYGMMVTDVIKDIILFINGKWSLQELSLEEKNTKLNDYNIDRQRYLYYPWGVFVTAIARKNLWQTILAVGNDYVYADTDSIFIKNPQKHIAFIRRYNDVVIQKLIKASNHYGIPLEYFMPRTIKGESKPMGIWEIEDIVLRFKSLGAKRYLYEKVDTSNETRKKLHQQMIATLFTDNPNWLYFESFRTSGKHTKLSLTVAGVNKKSGLDYLDRNGHNKAFEDFSFNLTIPKEYSGKSILTYITERRKGTVMDYLGNVGKYDELSCVHFDTGEYTFGVEDRYLDWISGLSMITE